MLCVEIFETYKHILYQTSLTFPIFSFQLILFKLHMRMCDLHCNNCNQKHADCDLHHHHVIRQSLKTNTVIKRTLEILRLKYSPQHSVKFHENVHMPCTTGLSVATGVWRSLWGTAVEGLEESFVHNGCASWKVLTMR